LISLNRLPLLGVLAALALGGLPTAPASAAVPPRTAVAGRDYARDEVVVRYAPHTGPVAQEAAERASGTASGRGEAEFRVLKIRDGRSVSDAIAALERRHAVVSATPSWIAHASFLPNDPGRAGVPGGWAQLQWNLTSPAGINAPAAWDNLIAAGRPGGRGVVVAVLDTGVAYADRGRYLRSPDLSADRFRRGYDFVSNDPFPLDENGHGTHVASTIAEVANNNVGVAGVAYGATIMPVRVLDRYGQGRTPAIADGIRYAVKHGAQVINLSFEFSTFITSGQIPDIMDALRYANGKGVVVVGAAGNAASPTIAYPARARTVIAVGATTEHLCLADYSNDGPGLDLVAPGGGPDADLGDNPTCSPADTRGRDIYQMTFTGSPRRFGLPGGYRGTSMATPHVAATAALVIASGVLGPDPTPRAVEARLKSTARDLGTPGFDTTFGAGLIDAAAATARTPGV
jgi:serine protease